MSAPLIQATTATLCQVMGVPWPQAELAAPLKDVLQAQTEILSSRQARKCLVYAPDALGHHLYRQQPEIFAEMEAACPLRQQVQAEMPAVTPVCFASMYSGLSPAGHGIQAYAKPVLSCQTLFDYLLAAGKRVAIVAVQDSSIERIFRERPLDYFSEPYDPEVTARALELLTADQHDFILVYHQEYDDQLHATTPFSPSAIQAALNHSQAFKQLAEAFHKHWTRYDRLLAVTPDHGAHLDPASGQGDHGLAIAEDLEVNHFYGLYQGFKS